MCVKKCFPRGWKIIFLVYNNCRYDRGFDIVQFFFDMMDNINIYIFLFYKQYALIQLLQSMQNTKHLMFF